MWDPREKSHRIIGNEREAGCDCNRGISKKERDAIPPDAMSAVVMLKIWIVCVADMLFRCEVRRLKTGVILQG